MPLQTNPDGGPPVRRDPEEFSPEGEPDGPLAMRADGRNNPRLPAGSDDPNRPLVGESSDPQVHQLLAQRQDAELNGDRDLVIGIDRRLAGLGYHRDQPTKEGNDGDQ